MAVLHCNDPEPYQKIISSGNAIIDFSAKWCGPCKMIAPHFETFAKENENIRFVHIDIDEAREKMEKELSDIQAVPTFKVYKNGELVKKFTGGNLQLLKESVDLLNGKETKKEEKKEDEKPKETAEPSKPEEQKESHNEKKTAVVHCDDPEPYQKFISSGNAIIDFSATWCGPCKMIAPYFEQYAKENENIRFVHIDIDHAREKMEKELSDIQAVPTFKVYKNGELVKKFTGGNLQLLKESVDLLNGKLDKKEEKKEEEKPKAETPAEKETEAKSEEQKDTHVVDNKADEAKKEDEKVVPEQKIEIVENKATESKKEESTA